MELLRRLKNRPDSEHHQAVARLVIAAVGLMYTLGIYQRDRSPTILYSIEFLVGYLILSAIIIALIILNPGISRARRAVALVSDISGCGIVMSLLGHAGLVFLWTQVWVTVGFGLRYGRRYLYAAMILGIVAYVLMVTNTPYWRDDPCLIVGYAGCLIILPLFFASLLKKLNATNAELAKLTEQFRKQATHDSLTGLPNRQLFLEELQHELAQAQRHNEQLVVFFIDLDGFKKINDDFGHQSGDELLKTIGKRLKAHVRKSDLVARLAGDEFVILMSGLDGDTAIRVAQKLIQDVSTPVAINGQRMEVTASIGIAIYPTAGNSSDEILAKADAAMYRSKQAGKNRIMVDGEEMPHVTDAPIHHTAAGSAGKEEFPQRVFPLRPVRPRT
jgi:diguanylate cyclase (GGDEF)-like protein